MKRTHYWRATASLLLLAATSWAQSQPKATGQTMKGSISESTEWQRVREGLKHARPMPMPSPMPGGGTPANAAEPASVSGGLVQFDFRTGHVHALPSVNRAMPLAPENGRPPLMPKPQQGKKGAIPASEWKDGAAVKTTQLSAASQATAAATAPSPDYFPYSFPFNTVARLLGRWNVNGVDYYWLCSTSTTSDYFGISAGHCVYNHDPTGDGSGTGASFASEMWVWAAETDVVDPVDPDNWPDFPYGVAKVASMTTYNAWISNSDLNWDFSFIQLDRRLGDHVGWMGREWNTQASSLNFDGYPAQAPYVPSDNPYQYPGYDANNVAYYTCCRIGMYAYTYGGHSGGPVWRFDGTNRYVEGVNSTSDRSGNAEATLLTSQIETDLVNTMAAASAPSDLAEVIEYVFNGTSKGLGQTSTSIGSTFPMTLNAFNEGFADAGNTSADIYLTSDPNNVTTGHYIGTYNFGYLGTYTYTVQTGNILIPTNTPPGTYYVGYVLNSANPQYYTDKNSVVIENQVMTAYCNADGYEPDNFASQASLLTSGSSQSHTICAQADQDWSKFTVNGTSAATIWTSGASGDTTMTLYDANLNQIDFNDDNGVNYFSTINRTCGSNPLPAGTYYVLVQSYHNATIIPSYTTSLSSSVCPAATATKVASSLNPSTYGNSVTFTATVTSAQSGTIAGSVTFLDGASSIGTAAISSGKASLAIASLAGGSHSITATYNGSSSYLSSTSGAISQKVNKAATTAKLTAAPSPSSFGQSVKLTATVKDGSLAAGGTVTFKSGTTNLGTASLSGTGVATLTTTKLPVGNDSLTAVYAGNTNFLGSTSAAVKEVVNKAKTTTTLASSANPATHGTSVTFTATIKPAFPGSPTGTVTFKDGTTTLGTGAVSSSTHQAKFTTSKLAVGSHSITAVYGGASNYLASTSAIVKEVIK